MHASWSVLEANKTSQPSLLMLGKNVCALHGGPPMCRTDGTCILARRPRKRLNCQVGPLERNNLQTARESCPISSISLLKNKDACTLATSRFFSLHDPTKDKTPQDSLFKVWMHPS
jgi:hypothetical protein